MKLPFRNKCATIGFLTKPVPVGKVKHFLFIYRDATKYIVQKITSSKWWRKLCALAPVDMQLNLCYHLIPKQDKMIGRLTWCLDQELRRNQDHL
jgi:hypothetical protein